MVQQTFYHQFTLLVRRTSYSVHRQRGVCFIESQLNKTTLQEREGLRRKTAAIFVLVKNVRASGQRNWSEGEKTGSEIGNSHEKHGLLALHTCTLNYFVQLNFLHLPVMGNFPWLNLFVSEEQHSNTKCIGWLHAARLSSYFCAKYV